MKKWLLIKQAGDIQQLRHAGDLKWMQEQVGGYVELIHVDWKGRKRHAYVDEDGRLKALKPNLIASATYGHVIVGNMLIDLGKEES